MRKSARIVANLSRGGPESAAMDDWVLDSLVGFLQSPMWGDAVNSFIENQCVGELHTLKALAISCAIAVQ